VRVLWAGAWRAVSPLALVGAVSRALPRFASGAQQDAEEFFTELVEALADERAAPAAPALFALEVSASVACGGCARVTACAQPAALITLALPRDGAPTSLDAALGALVAPEALAGADAYACERCAARQPATRRAVLSALPRALVFHFARNTFTDAGASAKNAARVTFPLAFASAALLGGGRATPAALAAAPRRYALRSLVEHRGRGARSGHYVAAVAGERGAWTLQNDERVGVGIAPADVERLEPYLLFYEADDD